MAGHACSLHCTGHLRRLCVTTLFICEGLARLCNFQSMILNVLAANWQAPCYWSSPCAPTTTITPAGTACNMLPGRSYICLALMGLAVMVVNRVGADPPFLWAVGMISCLVGACVRLHDGCAADSPIHRARTVRFACARPWPCQQPVMHSSRGSSRQQTPRH